MVILPVCCSQIVLYIHTIACGMTLLYSGYVCKHVCMHLFAGIDPSLYGPYMFAIEILDKNRPIYKICNMNRICVYLASCLT